jgi:hypothetical protein
MVEATTRRANIAHKLARYVRATPAHLTGVRGQSQPSTSHLSTFVSTKHSEEHPREDLETVLILGILLTIKKLFSRELATDQDKVKVENLLSLDQLSFYFQESAEEEELLF